MRVASADSALHSGPEDGRALQGGGSLEQGAAPSDKKPAGMRQIAEVLSSSAAPDFRLLHGDICSPALQQPGGVLGKRLDV